MASYSPCSVQGRGRSPQRMGLAPCETIGESPTLSFDEHKPVIDICVQIAKDSGAPLIAGCGSNSRPEAIELTLQASCVRIGGFFRRYPGGTENQNASVHADLWSSGNMSVQIPCAARE